MRICVIAQVEDESNLRQQIAKQTLKPNEVYIYTDPSPARTVTMRRRRIADNHELHLKKLVESSDCDLVWQLEGDVDLPNNALEELYASYLMYRGDDFGYVSGIQVGRHGLYCIGAWQNITDTTFNSIDPKLKGIQEVQATGFYCLLAPKDVWLSGVASWTDEPYGPDVVWGLSLNKKIYVDMDLAIGHVVERGVILPSHLSTCQAFFTKINNQWTYKTK